MIYLLKRTTLMNTVIMVSSKWCCDSSAVSTSCPLLWAGRRFGKALDVKHRSSLFCLQESPWAGASHTKSCWNVVGLTVVDPLRVHKEPSAQDRDVRRAPHILRFMQWLLSVDLVEFNCSLRATVCTEVLFSNVCRMVWPVAVMAHPSVPPPSPSHRNCVTIQILDI